MGHGGRVGVGAAERVASLRPRPLLVVTGCLISRYGQELGRELPEADLFLEIARQGELGAHVRKLLGRGEDTPPSRLLTTAPGFAYLKIAEGCDNRCRFCTVLGFDFTFPKLNLCDIGDSPVDF